MPRRPRCRMLDFHPEYETFMPEGVCPEGGPVVLTLDEYEAVRLVDLEGLKHEECAVRMGVSRTTVTEIYASARAKIADVLVNGRKLFISGGHVRFRASHGCGCFEEQIESVLEAFPALRKRGANQMIIVVPFADGSVYQHFGRTPAFRIFSVQEGEVTGAADIPNKAAGHAEIAALLSSIGTNAVICGGLGMGAVKALEKAGIELVAGAKGDADEAVKAYLAGSLRHNPEAVKKGHGHKAEGHGEGQGCGCGGHHRGEGESCGCGCGGHHGDGECGCGKHDGGECGCGCGGKDGKCGCGHHGEGECGCGGHHGKGGCGCGKHAE